MTPASQCPAGDAKDRGGETGSYYSTGITVCKGGAAFFSENIYNRGVTRAYGRYGTVRYRGAGVAVPCVAGAVRSVLCAVGRGAVPRVVVVQGAVPCVVGADRAFFYFFPAT